MNRYGNSTETGPNLPDDGHEIGPDAVHFVHKRNAGNMVTIRLVPHRLGLGLYPADTAEDHHGAIQHPQRALYLDGEVNMPRRVNDIDLVIAPETGRRSTCDGDAPFLFNLEFIEKLFMANAIRKGARKFKQTI